ncbi:hypothetical protein KEM52_001500, partial [Ascosphaera acerosa]
DFFYVCAAHLRDPAFASPLVDAAAEAARRRQHALDEEIARVKAEYEEKLRRRAAAEAGGDQKGGDAKDGQREDKEKDKDKGKEKEGSADDKAKVKSSAALLPTALGMVADRLQALVPRSLQTTAARTRSGGGGGGAAPDGSATATTAPGQDEPRVFALHKTFYQMRLARLRERDIARRNRERLANPAATFPAVPKDDL